MTLFTDACLIYANNFLVKTTEKREHARKRELVNFAPFEKEVSASFTPRLFAPSRRKGNVIIGVPFMHPEGGWIQRVQLIPADPSTASIPTQGSFDLAHDEFY